MRLCAYIGFVGLSPYHLGGRRAQSPTGQFPPGSQGLE